MYSNLVELKIFCLSSSTNLNLSQSWQSERYASGL